MYNISRGSVNRSTSCLYSTSHVLIHYQYKYTYVSIYTQIYSFREVILFIFTLIRRKLNKYWITHIGL